jgi:hypothetical protein
VGERRVTGVCAAPARYSYSVYGVNVTTDTPLEFPPTGQRANSRGSLTSLAGVEFVEGGDDDFEPFASAAASDGAFVCNTLPDGRAYLRWPAMYEFSVSADGFRVACRVLNGCDRSVFQNFLFGQVLGVALVRQGIEPLHAAVVCVDDFAVAFLGDCTYGKSTLMAAFVSAGHRVVTDDLLILDGRASEPYAFPGTGRIKLRPDSASHFLSNIDGGIPLSPMTSKRSFPLDPSYQQRSSVPLRALYVLPEPKERDLITSIEIRPARQAEMARELLRNTFIGHIIDRERLVQQFRSATQRASEIDGFRLRYPGGLHHLVALQRAIVEHSRRHRAGELPDGDSHEPQ